MNDTAAIIVSAGKSTRMNGINKQYAEIADKSVIEMSILAFDKCQSVMQIIIAVTQEECQTVTQICENLELTKPYTVCAGSDTRQKSVFEALKHIDKNAKYIAVHDGARPLIKQAHIENTIKDARVFGGAVLGVPVKDTIKLCDGGFVKDTPPRNALFITQTPQVFSKRIYFEAVDFALEHELDFTDDCQLAEAIGTKIYMTVGDYTNIKITTPEDIRIAQVMLGY